MKGKFIVIEGTDGSGKSTQFRLLVERLKKAGFPIETIKFPQYKRETGMVVSKYLNGDYGTADEVGPEVASLFYALDRYDAKFQLNKWLKEGKIIVADRYEISNRAYQGQKIPDDQKRNDFFKWITNLEYNILQIPKPDTTILLHVPIEFSRKLMANRAKRDYTDKTHDIHERDEELLKRTQNVYLTLAEDDGVHKISCVKDEKLRSIEDIHEEVFNLVKSLLD